MKIRAFLAVELEDGVRSRVAGCIDRMAPQVSGIKWVEPENIHLTMKFFGDVDQLEIPEICETVQNSIAGHEPFSMTCHGMGAFPKLARARTLWVGVTEGLEEMCSLQSDIDQQLKQVGFRGESRRFHPHITIGRVRDGKSQKLIEDLLQSQVEAEFGISAVVAVTLFSSQLSKAGPEYSVLARFDL